MDLAALRGPVADDLVAVDRLILDRLRSDVALINQVGHYIVNSGGKRLRPLVVVLATRALGYQGPHHIGLAAVVEFIHTATLLHDDVVDSSELRRSRQTANAVWGNAASVLVGDFLYSRSFEMMVEVGQMRVMDILSHATNRIAEGEVLQLLNCHEPDVDEARYREVILRKTATLFEAGARLGAVLCDAPAAQEQALADYGRHLGTAFQMIDDALDYGASSEDIGKNLGDDLAEGKPTLPLIYALSHSPPAEAARIRAAIEAGGLEDLAAITRTIESSGGLEYTARLAQHERDLATGALADLPDSAYKQALHALADFAVSRSH
jgi:octaprenyl-diphosphate synthase